MSEARAASDAGRAGGDATAADGPETRPRIALVVESMPAGGVESFVLRLGRGLRESGADVSVVVVRDRGAWFPRIAEAGLRAVDLGGEWRGPSLVARMRHARAIGHRLAAERFDVLLVNHVASVQAVLGMLPRTTAVVPVLHNTPSFVLDVGCRNRNAWNVTVAVGPAVRHAAERRVGAGAVREIWIGVDIPDAERLAQRPSLDGVVRIAVVGRLAEEQKNVLAVPEIVRRLTARGVSCRVVMLGDGPDRAALQGAIEAAGVGALVELRGAVPPDVVMGELLRAHVLLMPSRYEGLPNALLEAQACGCVPVASRLPGVTDAAVVDGETAMLVPPGDVAAFADAVAALAAAPERWAAMSRRAADHARTHHSTARMVAAYLALVGELRAGAHPRPPRRAPALNLRLLPWQESVPRPVMDLLRRACRRVG